MNDIVTFNNQSQMFHSLKCELERFSRGGHPFSIVLVRVHDEAHKQIILKSFRVATRIFDEIFEYKNNNDLLFSLKHCNASGAFLFIKRLKITLKEHGMINNIFEACVVDPIPGDDIQNLLTHLEQDLAKISEGGLGEVGQYQDISPLKRFSDSLKNKGEV
jgi:hypothetical protein